MLQVSFFRQIKIASSFSAINLCFVINVVEGTSVINGHKCNKVTSVIKIGHKCNKVTSVIRFGHKCNKVKSASNFGHCCTELGRTAAVT